jgi:predicted small secreted protein
MMRRSSLLPVLVAATLLTACGGGGDEAAGDVQTAGPDAWRVSPTSFGPLRIGQTVAEAAAAVGGGFAAAPDAAPACSYAVWPEAPAGVQVMLVNDTVVRVDVTQAGVTTVELGRIGDAEGRIQSLYAGKMLLAPHKYTAGKYMIVMPPEDSVHRIVFETDGKVVTEFRAGREPEVEWVERCG